MSRLSPRLLRLVPALGLAWTASPTVTAAQEEVTFYGDIQPIVSNFCATCHHGDDPQGGFVLDTYRDVREQAENGTLLERINDAMDPMPETGLMPLPMRRLFQAWVDGGYERGTRKQREQSAAESEFVPPVITPIDIRKEGFEFLEQMQGHWVGWMNLMGQDYDWFAFDYRAIGPSHVHGIFEGGTMGNLFTSFFVTDFRGTRTLMARNGGLLNGIYRTSYFVLTEVDRSKSESRYVFVDAIGGKDIMWIEVAFRGEEIEFKSYTSRMGMIQPPQRHMLFEGKRHHPELAEDAAKAFGFPKNAVDFDFGSGLPKPNWGAEYPVITSASYIWEEPGLSLVELAQRARDPYRIDQMPNVSRLNVSVERTEKTRGARLLMFLSREALTDRKGRFITEYGYVREDLLNGLLSFPEVSANRDEFEFTYLHPGDYFLTVIADMDADSYPSPGDVTHAQRKIAIPPRSTQKVHVDDLTAQN